MEYLAIADADRIQEYVFSPHELKMVRGASALHGQLIKEIGDHIVSPNRRISAAGGVVLGAFASKDAADEFCRKAEKTFLKKTHSATVTTAAWEYPSGQFKKSWEQLLLQLERNKRARSVATFRGGSPFWVACEACGLRWASEALDEGEVFCPSCVTKRVNSKRPEGGPEDFEAIGLKSKPQNYLAIVYIDIDRLGEYLRRNVSLEADCTAVSEGIDTAVRESVAAGLAGVAPDWHEILLIGGDDAYVALPADLAFEFTSGFARAFGRKDRWTKFPAPVFSVSIVIAHSHFPISEFLRIGKRLMRSAKRKRDKASVHCAIISASLEDRRNSDDVRARTGYPYELEEFQKLLDTVRELKRNKAPASQIKALYGIAWQGRAQAELDYLFLLTRLDREHRDTVRGFLGGSLWKERGGVESTCAPDLVELWEFVHEK